MPKAPRIEIAASYYQAMGVDGGLERSNGVLDSFFSSLSLFCSLFCVVHAEQMTHHHSWPSPIFFIWRSEIQEGAQWTRAGFRLSAPFAYMALVFGFFVFVFILLDW